MSWGLLRDGWRGWDHLGVLLSLVYRLVRCMHGLLVVLARSDLSKVAELLVLCHENQVLRRQLSGGLQPQAAPGRGERAANRGMGGAAVSQPRHGPG